MPQSDSPLPPRETLLVVTIYEELADVLARLRAHANSAVRLEIPESSPLFLTATDFRALRDVAQYRRIALTVVTDDPLRQQLAQMFHIPVAGTGDPWTPSPGPPPSPLGADAPPPVPSWGGIGLPPLPEAERPSSVSRARPESDVPTRRNDERGNGARRPYNVEARPSGPVPRRNDPNRPLRRGASTLPPPVPNRSLPLDAEPSARPGSPRSTRRDEARRDEAIRPDDAIRGRERDRGGLSSPASEIRWPTPPAGPSRRSRATPAIEPDVAEHEDIVPGPVPASERASIGDRTRRTRPERSDAVDTDAPVGTPRLAVRDWRDRLRDISPKWITIVAGGLAILIFLVYGITILAFSSANVTLALSATPVTTSATCEVVAPGTPSEAEVVIEATPFETTITYQGSIATTGTRPNPTELARGEVVFANPTGSDVTIEAGTELTGANGRTYRTTEAVTIPAGNPNTGQASRASVPVEAAQPGADSNLGIGELSGQLENGVYYSNREAPIEGGLDSDVRTVTPADIAALRDQARSELERLAQEGQFEGLPEGAVVMQESVQLGDPTFEESLQAGEDADEVSITATADVSLLLYQPDDLQSVATAYVREKLATVVPADHMLDEASIEVGSLQQQSADAERVSFTISANAMTIPTFTEEDRDALAKQLEGKSAEEASAILRGMPNFASYDVDYSPWWLPDRMPSSASRIEIEVTS